MTHEANGPDWAAIRAGYERGGETVAALCRRHGIEQTALYRRRRAEGWAPRRTFRRGRRRRNALRRDMIARSFEALERQMDEIESSLAAPGEAGDGSAAARERDARTLSSLVRTLEKLFALDTGADPAATARKEAAHRDVEHLRQALAQRIERLAGGWKD